MMESPARVVAEQLAGEFLKGGNYEAPGAAMDAHTLASILPAAAAAGAFPHFAETGFAGLAVQAVGYTAGAAEESVIVYVTRGSKRSLDKLSTNASGVPIRAVQLGKLIVKPEMAATAAARGKVYERNGRIACGSSCAPAGENYAGTFGALAQRDGELMILSNNHVFAACNHVPVGQPILAPSAMDARPELPAPRELCRHADIVELRSGTPTLVPLTRCDAAVARVPDGNLVSSWQGDDHSGYDTPVTPIAPQADLRVKKVGRTTGLTSGVVEALITSPWPLPYKNRNFAATVWFTDIWTIRAEDSGPFALPGDSGSLVVTEGGDAAVGLLFATSSKGETGFIAPIATVLQELNLNLTSNHGI